jgi:hypothetical protein
VQAAQLVAETLALAGGKDCQAGFAADNFFNNFLLTRQKLIEFKNITECCMDIFFKVLFHESNTSRIFSALPLPMPSTSVNSSTVAFITRPAQ